MAILVSHQVARSARRADRAGLAGRAMVQTIVKRGYRLAVKPPGTPARP
jgi:hypothetical protein